MSDDLRAALAKIKPGDEVTVAVDYCGRTATVSGKAWRDRDVYLFIGNTVIQRPAGAPGNDITAVLDHKPHVPEVTTDDLDALPVWSVVTGEVSAVWTKYENGLWNGWAPSKHVVSNFAPLTIRHPHDGAA